MAIRVRRGNEADFDANKMLPGEWAVSLDTKYVRMCFAPGVCLRMATYEGFESDMERVEAILEEVETIDEAIKVIYEEFKQAAVDIEIASKAAETATQKAADAEAFASSASESATEAEESASNATRSEESALLSAEAAGLAKDAAKTSEENASASAIVSAQKADAAAESAESASDSEENASAYSLTAKSYAVGGTGTRPNEDFDNAKYYMEQAKSISDIKGGLVPMGTITFSQLSIDNAEPGYMYNISNEFTTTSSFKEGAGKVYPPGTNVYLTADGYWDCFGGSPFVSGVKGSAESSYRRGNVEITAANIGLGNVDNTADKDKTVKHANTAGSATSDGNGNEIAKTYAKASDFSNVDNTADKDKSVKHAETADKATKDGNGNIISEYYAPKEHGGHVEYGTTAQPLGTSASAGTSNSVSRSDHIHPLPNLDDCKGTLSLGKGGTGATTAKGAEYNVLSGMIENSVSMDDNSRIICAYTYPNTTDGRLFWRKASVLWNYIKSKINAEIPTATVRYVSDESDADYDWVQVKDANGNWVNWKTGNLSGLYVIKKGQLIDGYSFAGYNDTNQSVVQNSDSVTFKKPNTTKTGGLMSNGIDVTKYTKFKFTVSALSDTNSYVAIFGTNAMGELKTQILTPSAKTYEADLSNVSGVIYIGVVMSINGSRTITMTDMHFE